VKHGDGVTNRGDRFGHTDRTLRRLQQGSTILVRRSWQLPGVRSWSGARLHGVAKQVVAGSGPSPVPALPRVFSGDPGGEPKQRPSADTADGIASGTASRKHEGGFPAATRIADHQGGCGGGKGPESAQQGEKGGTVATR